MAKCDACGSTILFGGKRNGDLRFCNDRCLARGASISTAREIPEDVVRQRVWSVHQGRCPRCNGPGPVDVHVSHRVWSALVLTSWKSEPRISCRSCGVKRQIGDAAFSLAFGWWGIPWGLVLTPVQIGRNVVGTMRGPDPSAPSEQLSKHVRLTLAAQAAATPGAHPGEPGVI